MPQRSWDCRWKVVIATSTTATPNNHCDKMFPETTCQPLLSDPHVSSHSLEAASSHLCCITPCCCRHIFNPEILDTLLPLRFRLVFASPKRATTTTTTTRQATQCDRITCPRDGPCPSMGLAFNFALQRGKPKAQFTSSVGNGSWGVGIFW